MKCKDFMLECCKLNLLCERHLKNTIENNTCITELKKHVFPRFAKPCKKINKLAPDLTGEINKHAHGALTTICEGKRNTNECS